MELTDRTYFQPTGFNVHVSKQQIKYWRHPGCNWKAQRVQDLLQWDKDICVPQNARRIISICQIAGFTEQSRKNIHANKEQFASFLQIKELEKH